MEQTLILVKPDGVQRGLIGQIISRFESRGMKLVGLKFIQMTNELAAQHYAVHQGKNFYDSLIEYIVSGPVVAMVWAGEDAIAAARATMGSTRPVDSLPGTIRGDFGMEVGRNLVHGSDEPENAKKEVALFFDKSELINWQRESDKWIKE
jgi:nucleoside-diphosphate kinase